MSTSMRLRLRHVFGGPSLLPAVCPVIHVRDAEQVLGQVQVALKAGCRGVFLINHDDEDPASLLPVLRAVRGVHGPEALALGVNFHCQDGRVGFPLLGQLAAEQPPIVVDALWCDNAWIDEKRGAYEQEQPIAAQILAAKTAAEAAGWSGMYIGSVAFKNKKVPDARLCAPVPAELLGHAAAVASAYCDVVLTTGDAAADWEFPKDEKDETVELKSAAMRTAAPAAALGLGSGVSDGTVGAYADLGLDIYLVASSIAKDGDGAFHEMDSTKLYNLSRTVRRKSSALLPSDLAAEAPLFRIGTISDIQHADLDDGTNFSQTMTRYYRGALGTLGRAVEAWNGLSEPPVALLLQGGDLIDGKCATVCGIPPADGARMKGWADWQLAHGAHEVAHTDFTEHPSSLAALSACYDVLSRSAAPVLHAVGNHEVYNFTRATLNALAGPELRPRPTAALRGVRMDGWGTAPGASSPPLLGCCSRALPSIPGWRFVVLDSYDVSCIGWGEGERQDAAFELCQAHNPNNLREAADWGKGMEGEEKRWMPFGGAVGEEQLGWLRAEIRAAAAAAEKVIVMAHVPMLREACSDSTMLWNAEEVRKALHEVPGVVKLVLSGHDHAGGFGVDERGLSYLTLNAPLETSLDCWGTLEIYADRIELRGEGAVPSRVIPF